ncbi:MAG: hypothetical protein JO015_13295 [Verrucomicrobia bacterium]|nr:hypothetical protein [Verrucomicrobiota bacterium]
MENILDKVCVLVTSAFVLALVPPPRGRPQRSLLAGRDRGTALLIFAVLGSVEELADWHTGWLNERIVAVCAAGLVAGPLGGPGDRGLCDVAGRLARRLAAGHHRCGHARRRLGRGARAALRIEERIDPGIDQFLVPPFSLQPLVENAVQHGLHPCPHAGCLRLAARRAGAFLELSVGDDGRGMAPAEVERVFFGPRPQAHALSLLRRRLQGLFGDCFRLEVRSALKQGTTVTMRLPLQTRPEGAAQTAPLTGAREPRVTQ